MLPKELIKRYKRIYISVSGFIDVSNLACLLIDTKEFQRLRHLHQLGTGYFVFPSASNSRFEHSLGTYNLADKLLNTIKETTSKEVLRNCLMDVPELKEYYKNFKKEDVYLNDWICELIKLAALTHDIGHGPFSHVYDEYMHLIKKSRESHEDRSGRIFSDVMGKHLTKSEINFIKILIEPPKERKGFIYEIICNKSNSIDVDKLDYANRDTYSLGLKESYDISPLVEDVRVINNKICYPVQLSYPITNLFTLRYRLHKQICSHKTVVSSQYMILDILKFVEHRLDYDFMDMTDYLVLSIPRAFRIKEAVKILDRIYNRDFYKCIDKKVFKTKKERDIYYEDNLKKLEGNVNFRIHRGEISMFPKDILNPFENIYFYERKYPDKCFILNKDQISFLLPENFREYYIYLFET
uniref:HD/PDEase domain-containing protein n=1 Tax=viral metagenome TaxID=1070528 RepID=A0A6C0ACF3_9ZZZZ